MTNNRPRRLPRQFPQPPPTPRSSLLGTCPLCASPCDSRILDKSTGADSLTPAVVGLIRAQHPDWQPGHGVCPECAGRFAQHLANRRSPESLQQTTQPHSAFPYYHRDEATVLSQTQRLAHHWQFTGAGVTIAFLDSGFYPHPDLGLSRGTPIPPPPVDLTWGRSALSTQKEIAHGRGDVSLLANRIVHYVDQQDGAEREGTTEASLWDDAGDSWHGQMTTVLAAGNGRLSGGKFAGFAPEAGILPIKIGRKNGRIPEADILRGAEWLLRDDNWRRYGVRVLNVSVGGDDPMHWRDNPVCLAMERLSERGVLVVAAGGNSGRQSLVAPAQTPAVLTVGGVDDHNRPWRRYVPEEIGQLDLYHHNWDWIEGYTAWQSKPDILAPAQWVPGPILPVSSVFGEMMAATAILRALEMGQSVLLRRLLDQWAETLGLSDPTKARPDTVRRAVARLRNKHKWVAPFTQHVDGTSTAAPLVAGVAAQMFQANPSLTPADAHRILRETAMPLPHHPAEKQGAGLIQPALAVAVALRTPGGPRHGRPVSGLSMGSDQFSADELQKITIQGKVAEKRSPGDNGAPSDSALIYFGYYAPQAESVSLIGPFNRWQPHSMRLVPCPDGWWHGVLGLAKGAHPYRFWITGPKTPQGEWAPDPENPSRMASGYLLPHSVAVAS